MSIITLLTDFGTQDTYVSAMKGVILSVNPHTTIIDITHALSPQDIFQGAYSIKSAFRYFPKGTVHVVVVDPGVGSDRAIIAVKAMGHIFLAPDNGVLTLIMEEDESASVVLVNNSAYYLPSVSRTFHGRDIFAPVAAHIKNGVNINKLGEPIDKKDIIYLDIKKPGITDTGELSGIIVSVDHFGNLVTNIDASVLENYGNGDATASLKIRVGDVVIKGISTSYTSVNVQTLLAIIGSDGYLEIALNGGSAAHHLKSMVGDIVHIHRA